MAGGLYLCLASGMRGVSGVDFGAKKYPLGGFLFERHAGLSAFRPAAPLAAVFSGGGAVCAGLAQQNSNGHAAGGVAGHLLVAKRPAQLETRRAAVGAMV